MGQTTLCARRPRASSLTPMTAAASTSVFMTAHHSMRSAQQEHSLMTLSSYVTMKIRLTVATDPSLMDPQLLRGQLTPPQQLWIPQQIQLLQQLLRETPQRLLGEIPQPPPWAQPPLAPLPLKGPLRLLVVVSTFSAFQKK